MTNPFASRLVPLSGPARDLIPVSPNDTTDLTTTAVSLYIEAGGDLSLSPRRVKRVVLRSPISWFCRLASAA